MKKNSTLYKIISFILILSSFSINVYASDINNIGDISVLINKDEDSNGMNETIVDKSYEEKEEDSANNFEINQEENKEESFEGDSEDVFPDETLTVIPSLTPNVSPTPILSGNDANIQEDILPTAVPSLSPAISPTPSAMPTTSSDIMELFFTSENFEINNKVVTVEGNMPKNAEIIVEPVKNIDKIEEIIKDADGIEHYNYKFSVREAYDIKIIANKELFQPLDYDTEITIKISNVEIAKQSSSVDLFKNVDVPDKYENSLQSETQIEVHRITDDEEVTRLDASLDNEGTLSFNTDHFTTFTIDEVSYNLYDSIQTYQFGDNITGYLFDDMTLILDGSGEMYDYDYNGGNIVCRNNLYYDAIDRSTRHSIQKLYMSDEITTIGDFAFYDCYNMNVVSGFPDSLEYIGIGAFSSEFFFSIDSSKVEYIDSLNGWDEGTSEFFNELLKYPCPQLTISDSLPDTVTYIGAGAFCPMGDVFHGQFDTVQSYGANFYTCYRYPNVKINSEFPSSLTYIGNYAFSGCQYVQFYGSVPSSLTYIGDYAFGLFQSTVSGADLSAYYSPYYDGRNLCYINQLPDSLTYIGEGAFSQCQFYKFELYSLPDGLEHIGSRSFAGTFFRLETNSLPSSLKYIGDCPLGDSNHHEFSGQYSGLILGSSYNKIHLPDGLEHIGERAFSSEDGSNFDINLTGELPSKLNYVGYYAFSNCSNVSFTGKLPDSLNYVDRGAFSNCISTTFSGELPSLLTYYHSFSFNNCGFDGNLVFPDTVTYIDESAFRMTTLADKAPTYIVLPDNIKTIGKNAFYVDIDNENERVKTKIVTKNKVALNYDWASNNRKGYCYQFGNDIWGCVETNDGEIELSLDGTGNMYDWNSITKANEFMTQDVRESITKLVFDNRITTIGSAAFSNLKNCKNVNNLPSGLTSLGWSAFMNCSAMELSGDAPSSITFINSQCFYGCEKMTLKINVGNLTRNALIGQFTFYNCKNMNIYGGFSASLTGIKKYAFGNCNNAVISGEISSKINLIEESAFKDCKKCTFKVDIGNLTKNTEIGNSTFYNCEGINVYGILPSNIKMIGSYAFFGCKNSTLTGNFPSDITEIKERSFSFCSNMTLSGSLPSNLTYIGDYTFYECSKMEISGELPSKLVSIGKGSFGNCSSMVISGKLPVTLTKIGEAAFQQCSNMTIGGTLSETLTDIGPYAFNLCQKMTISGTWPATITIIPKCVFNECSKMNISSEIPNGVTKIEDHAFDNCGMNGDIIIPDSVEKIGIKSFSVTKGVVPIWKKITIGNGVTEIGENAFLVNYENEDIVKVSTDVETTNFNAKKYDWISDNRSTCFFRYGDNIVGTIEDFDSDNLIVYNLYHLTLEGFGEMYNFDYDESNGDIMLDGAVFMTRNISKQIGAISFSDDSNITTIGDNAFNGLYNCYLSDNKFPESITTIGSFSFKNCYSFHSNLNGVLIFPDNITKIGYGAFYLENPIDFIGYEFNFLPIQEIHIPDNLEEIGENVFFYYDEENPLLTKLESSNIEIRNYDWNMDNRIIVHYGYTVGLPLSVNLDIIVPSTPEVSYYYGEINGEVSYFLDDSKKLYINSNTNSLNLSYEDKFLSGTVTQDITEFKNSDTDATYDESENMYHKSFTSVIVVPGAESYEDEYVGEIGFTIELQEN